MLSSVFFHPVATFLAGIILTLCVVVFLLNSCAPANQSKEKVAVYRKNMEKVAPSGIEPGSSAEAAALKRFSAFLEGIGDTNYVRENALKVYSSDAYLDDTLMIHHGAAEIEAYFVKTSETMTSYKTTVDDIARSGNDYYVRWTMEFAAPALSGGESITSVGVSQVRFNREGKVAFHQDFWDSGKNFYAHLPVIGGAVGYVGKRLESN
jgi:hypothetical protein